MLKNTSNHFKKVLNNFKKPVILDKSSCFRSKLVFKSFRNDILEKSKMELEKPNLIRS